MGKMKEVQNNLDMLNFTSSEHEMSVTFEYHEGYNKYCLYRKNNSDEPVVVYDTYDQMSSFLDALELIRLGKI